MIVCTCVFLCVCVCRRERVQMHVYVFLRIACVVCVLVCERACAHSVRVAGLGSPLWGPHHWTASPMMLQPSLRPSGRSA